MLAIPPSVTSIGISITVHDPQYKAIKRSTLSSMGIRFSRIPTQVSGCDSSFDIYGHFIDTTTRRSHRNTSEGRCTKRYP